jgi:D-glycero-alpha-D-manno-heptose-7-phosphate kinase
MNAELISIKSPTRVDLAGGTLDMWPLFSFLGEATTINLAIDIWTKVEIRRRNDKQIKIHSLDLKKEWIFNSLDLLLNALDPQIILYQKIFERFKTDEKEQKILNLGFEFTTSSESPIGGGLGGSSSLIISILKGLYQLIGRPITSVHEIVHLAHNIEAEVLRTPTGTQDYYPAMTGGLGYIHYSASGIEQQIFSIKNTPFQDHFLLVNTGKSHHSGLNNFEVLKSAIEKDITMLEALKKIKDISNRMTSVITSKKWDELPLLFQQEFEARIQLTPAFSSPEIEKLSMICLAAGALAVKICGAGGGGCVLVWVAPSHREKVVQVCQNEKFQCLNAQPVDPLM